MAAQERGGPVPMVWAWGQGHFDRNGHKKRGIGGVRASIMILQAVESAVPLSRWIWCEPQKTVDPLALRAALAAAGTALGKLHRIGVIHGDLQPENILLQSSDTQKMTATIIDMQKAFIAQRDGGQWADPFLANRMNDVAAWIAPLCRRMSAAMVRGALEHYLAAMGDGTIAGLDAETVSRYHRAVDALAMRQRKALVAQRTRRAMRNTKYAAALRIKRYWTGRVFLAAKHADPDSAVSAQNFTKQQWQAALDDFITNHDARCADAVELKGPDLTVGTLNIGGQSYRVVCREHRPEGFLTQLRVARAEVLWQKTWAVITADVATAWPLAALTYCRWGRVLRSVLICEYLENAKDLRQGFRDGTLPTSWAQQKALARQIGRTLGMLDVHGMRHRDSKTTNIMMQSIDHGESRVVLIDLDGIAKRCPWDKRNSLERLMVCRPIHNPPTLRQAAAVFHGYRQVVDPAGNWLRQRRRQLWRQTFERADQYRMDSGKDKKKEFETTNGHE